MSDKEKYINFIQERNDIYVPLFQQPFWLDNFAEKWDVVLYETDERIVAALPFCLKGNLFTRRIYLPDVSFYQSILFFEEKKEIQQQVTLALFEKLPKTIKQYFKFLPEYSLLSLGEINYKRTDYTTYLITKKNTLSKHHQRKINKAGNSNYMILINEKTEEAYHLMRQTFERQKVKIKLSFAGFEHLYQVSKRYDCGNLYICIDTENNILAIAFIVSDKQTNYYLYGAFNIAYKNSGAMHFLLNQMIEKTLQENKTFNFCGSSKLSIAQFFEGFGAGKATIPIWTKLL